MADRLKLAPIVQSVEDEFLSWRANYVQEHGQRFVVFMNDASRFSVVINEAKAARLKKLPELFASVLRDTLLAIGVNPEVADKYIAELGDITYSKNSDRKKTAQLNKHTDRAWWGFRDNSSDVELSLFTNNDLYNISSGYENVIYPNKKMLEMLGRYGLPVRRFQAFDICARLDLEGKDAIRRLRVPAFMTFERLHRVLQNAFGWKSYHLYSFGLFKEWSDEYYARPDVELASSGEDFDMNPDAKPMAGVTLSDYVPEYRKILYIYDYGDDWHHYIEIENIIDGCDEDLPILLSGEGDAPPEDVGGPGGFAVFLEIMANPQHEEHQHLKEWAGSQWWHPFDFEGTARSVRNMFL
jgi:hypothetical protein